MLIVTDFDDCLSDTLSAWVEYLNKKYNLHKTLIDMKDWTMEINFPELSSDQIYKPLTSDEFWETVKPKNGAKEFISWCKNNNHELYICTDSRYDTLDMKWNHCINKLFPELDWCQFIICKHKYLVDADIFIDDKGSTILDRNKYKPNSINILMNAYHNLNIDTSVRINSLMDICNLI